jgi:hypothetical protein
MQNLTVAKALRAGHIQAKQPQPPAQAQEHLIHQEAFHAFLLHPQLFID